MAKFKVNDEVVLSKVGKAVMKRIYETLPVDYFVGVVTEVHKGDTYVVRSKYDVNSYWLREKDLKHVPMPKFKVGDKVINKYDKNKTNPTVYVVNRVLSEEGKKNTYFWYSVSKVNDILDINILLEDAFLPYKEKKAEPKSIDYKIGYAIYTDMATYVALEHNGKTTMAQCDTRYDDFDLLTGYNIAKKRMDELEKAEFKAETATKKPNPNYVDKYNKLKDYTYVKLVNYGSECDDDSGVEEGGIYRVLAPISLGKNGRPTSVYIQSPRSSNMYVGNSARTKEDAIFIKKHKFTLVSNLHGTVQYEFVDFEEVKKYLEKGHDGSYWLYGVRFT